jgi:hypothetical protein
MKLYKITIDKNLYFNNKQSALGAVNALLQSLPVALKTTMVEKVGKKDSDDWRGYDDFVTGYKPVNVSVEEASVDFKTDEEVEKIEAERKKANAKLGF